MAITTLDGLVAGYQPNKLIMKSHTTGLESAGQHWSSWLDVGHPVAAAAPAAGMAGETLDNTVTGAINFGNTTGGEKQYLVNGFIQNFTLARMFLHDRLWQNSGIAVTTTTAQTINSVTWPARDATGSTNGLGVMVGLEVNTATTNAGVITNTTMSYTNSDGTSGRTATLMRVAATSALASFYPFRLQTGDKGVRSIQSITLGTSYGGGSISLVAYKTLYEFYSIAGDARASQLEGPFYMGMPEIINGFCGWITVVPNASNAGPFYAILQTARG
jgi:hypothetical protein